jgi:nucleoside-diphosphate-sugar epimerase
VRVILAGLDDGSPVIAFRFRRSRRRQDRVLVTGAAGTIGGIVLEGLGDDYATGGLDIAPGPGVAWVGDMRRLDDVERRFDGMAAVVDLAADASASAPWESVLANNVPATVNALEAASRARVRRVVFASSNHVVGLYEQDEPYASVVAGRYEGLEPSALPRLTSTALIRPDGPYGVGKAFGEAAARYYSERFDLSVICLRIGTVLVEDRPRNPRHFATLLTHRDLVQLVRCCLEAPETVQFGIFYGVSANTWRFWDIEEARETIGYVPADDAEAFR